MISILNVLNKISCGLDVHKSFIVAVVIDNTKEEKYTKKFGTMPCELKELKEWVLSYKCTSVAMESTGKYWIPVYNILENSSIDLTLGNSREIKNMPGRKTDFNDAVWIAKIHSHGLIPKSFIPPLEIRELRELTRYRRKLIQAKSTEKNRVNNCLTISNIMLDNVVTDVFGKSGNNIIDLILKDEKINIDTLSNITYGQVKKKGEEILKSIDSAISSNTKEKMKLLYGHIKTIDEMLDTINELIDEKTKKYKKEIELLITIPGVQKRSAEEIIAEIGIDMNQFEDSDHLASWAGLSPGNNRSANTIKSSRTCEGNAYIKRILAECSLGASKEKKSYLGAKYWTLKSKRGTPKAITAISRVIIVSIWHMLSKKENFSKVDRETYQKTIAEKNEKKMIKQLQKLGYKVEK